MRSKAVAALVGPASDATIRGGVGVVLDRVARVALVVGLFTASWDRLANVTAGPYNVKIAAVAFSVGALAGVPLVRGTGLLRRSGLLRAAFSICVAIVAMLVLSSALAPRPAAGAAQIAAVLTGAMAPALALVAILRTRDDLRWALRWFVLGAGVACVFGLYQLAAFYTGLPQIVAYTGLGVDGTTGRIAAFSYEPAYFANFVVLAAGASAALALLGRRRLGWLAVVGFSVVLVLANVRALVFLVPVLGVLLALRWRQNRGLLLRAVIAGVAVVAINAGVTSAVTQFASATSASPDVSTQPSSIPVLSGNAPPTSASPGPSTTTAPPASVAPVVSPSSDAADSPTNVLDPNEQSSNAPRLALYKAVIAAVGGRPLLGVGPGNLGDALRAGGYAPDNAGAQVIANNIWLQAYADGGIPLLLLELSLSVVVVLMLFRRSMTLVQPLAASWLAVVLVSGMLTSYFFDIKLWVAMGLLLAASAMPAPDGEHDQHPPEMTHS